MISGRRPFQREGRVTSLTNQQIMVDDKGSHFQAMLSDIFAGYQNPPLSGDVARKIRLGKSGKAPPSTGGSTSLTLPSGAPLPVVGFQNQRPPPSGEASHSCQSVPLSRLVYDQAHA